MKKYRYSTGMGIEKVIVDDLDNNRATIFYSNGHIEKFVSYRYETDYHQELWFDSLDDCLYDRLITIYHLWEEHYEPYSEYLQAREDDEQIVSDLYRLCTNNSLDDLYEK